MNRTFLAHVKDVTLGCWPWERFSVTGAVSEPRAFGHVTEAEAPSLSWVCFPPPPPPPPGNCARGRVSGASEERKNNKNSQRGCPHNAEFSLMGCLEVPYMIELPHCLYPTVRSSSLCVHEGRHVLLSFRCTSFCWACGQLNLPASRLMRGLQLGPTPLLFKEFELPPFTQLSPRFMSILRGLQLGPRPLVFLKAFELYNSLRNDCCLTARPKLEMGAPTPGRGQ